MTDKKDIFRNFLSSGIVHRVRVSRRASLLVVVNQPNYVSFGLNRLLSYMDLI